MSYLSAMQGVGGAMSPNPATQGLGDVPKLPNLPPAPTGVGGMPVGAPGTTKKAAADDAISALRGFQGFAPELLNEINAVIDRIKSVAQDKPGENPGPALGQPGASGAAQSDSSPLQASGSVGPY